MKNIYLDQSNARLINALSSNSIPTKLANLWVNEIPPSSTIHHANKQLEWFAEDEKTRINPEYIDRKVIHTMDEYGYRIYPNYHPTSNKNLFCFGCSETYGFSASDEETWPYLLAKKLGNWKVKNYGICAGSMEAIARTCYQVINSIKKEEYPDVIYVLIPDPLRGEYIGNCDTKNGASILHRQICLRAYEGLGDILNKINVDNIHDTIEGKNYSYCKYTSRVHSFFETVQNFRFMQEFLISTNIQWYWYSWSSTYCKFTKQDIIDFFGENTIFDEYGLKFLSKNNNSKNMKARDNRHAGFGYHDILSDEFCKLYKK